MDDLDLWNAMQREHTEEHDDDGTVRCATCLMPWPCEDAEPLDHP